MDWTNIPAGKLNAATQRFWVAVGDKADFVVRSINNDEGYLLHLAEFAKHPGFADKMSSSLNPQWLRAREIMGENFFGVEEAITHFGVNPSKRQQLAHLVEIPFAESVLEACKNTHVLVAVFLLSLLDIRGICKDQGLFHNQDWYDKQGFAKQKGKVGWQLIRKTPVDDSTLKTWDEQNKLLSKDEEVPSVRAVVYAMVGHYKTTGERLFEKIWVRCSDLDSDGRCVRVGFFDARGLHVNDDLDAVRDSGLGVSSARKS